MTANVKTDKRKKFRKCVLLGAALLGEAVTAGLIGGLALVAAGLVLITRK